ncbi:sodium:proton antiporter [bacterium C-53]|nr:sodium:proton antiporter [Lachnospiraceae bacterium]NBI02275.1 sodium:proton antiporter [Lachnospiraceae bacterium]RKJ11842.1 sodium:proton antiporter [bacterium C-53]
MEWLRFIAAAILILLGLIMELIAVFGVYRFKFVLNRMHSAAIGDTLALGLVIAGLIVMKGFSLVSLKLLFVLFCLWVASSVSGHVLSRMEVTIDEEDVHKNCEVQE